MNIRGLCSFVQKCRRDKLRVNCVTIQRLKTCPTILIIEDYIDTLEEVKETLSTDGYITLSAESVQAFEAMKKHHVIDLFLIDLNLPDGNGLALAREIRAQSDVGIIILSGKNSEIDRVVGLEIGADDYITKPFSPREMQARVQSVLRRTYGNKFPRTIIETIEDVVEFLDWKLDLGSHHLSSKSGEVIELTSAEFDLLRVFVESPKRVLSRDFLLGKLHGVDWVGYDRGVDGLVSRLRKKMKKPNQTEPLIKTLRGVGYMFTSNVKNSS